MKNNNDDVCRMCRIIKTKKDVKILINSIYNRAFFIVAGYPNKCRKNTVG